MDLPFRHCRSTTGGVNDTRHGTLMCICIWTPFVCSVRPGPQSMSISGPILYERRLSVPSSLASTDVNQYAMDHGCGNFCLVRLLGFYSLSASAPPPTQPTSLSVSSFATRGSDVNIDKTSLFFLARVYLEVRLRPRRQDITYSPTMA